MKNYLARERLEVDKGGNIEEASAEQAIASNL